MRATSEASLAAARERFAPVLESAGAQGVAIGEAIFAVVDALDGSGSLRRALTDPTRTGEAKAALASQLLSGQVPPDVVALVGGLVRDRWSAEADLADALEEIGTEAVLAGADAQGELLRVEDELFRLQRTFIGDADLRVALASTELPAARRTALVDSLLGEASEPTRVLMRRTVGALRQRALTARLAAIGEMAARRRRRIVATVLAAVPLTVAQRDRLSSILSRAYGGDVQLNVALDPTLLGGLRVQVGSELVDATILSKLEEARRRIAN